jgi:VanZ family protein
VPDICSFSFGDWHNHGYDFPASSMPSFLKCWLPPLTWMAIIFAASGDSMSSERTSRFLVPFLLWLEPGISPEAIWWIQFFIRKAAHLIEYAILAMLLWRALYHGTNVQPRLRHLFATVWLAATLMSAADEFRQSFVPSREATWRDVLIDSIGAAFGLLIVSRFTRRKREKVK